MSPKKHLKVWGYIYYMKRCKWVSAQGEKNGDQCNLLVKIPERDYCSAHHKLMEKKNNKEKYKIEEVENCFRIRVRTKGEHIEIKKRFGSRKSKEDAYKEIVEARNQLLNQ